MTFTCECGHFGSDDLRGFARHQATCQGRRLNQLNALIQFRTKGRGLSGRSRERKRDEMGDLVDGQGTSGLDIRESTVEAQLPASGSEYQPPPLSCERAESLPPAGPDIAGPSSTTGRRPLRANRAQLPSRYHDFLPHGPSPLPPRRSPTPIEPPQGPCSSTAFPLPPPTPPASSTPQITRTKPNRFGLIREYVGELPLNDPDDELPLSALLDTDMDNDSDHNTTSSPMPLLGPSGTSPSVTGNSPLLSSTGVALTSASKSAIIAPYPNMSSYLLGNWFWNGSRVKSLGDRDSLLNDVILHKDFDREEVRGIVWSKIDKDLASGASSLLTSEDGWQHTDVTISVPLGKGADVPSRTFTISGLSFRPLEKVVKRVCESEASARFHYHPFRLLWQPPPIPSSSEDLPPLEDVYGELYTSKVFRDAYEELQQSPREPGCDLPRAIIALMPWSDSTHLADFGTASLWPVYMQFGNQSKDDRAKPTAHACHHVAYIPKLPDEIQDFIHGFLEREGINPLLAHCRRELMQAIWSLLLSDKFVAACRHGIVVKCYDGITRRLYIRIFTYSADYPEKVLLATVRDMGNCPCPRCLVPKEKIAELGTSRDQDSRVRLMRRDDRARQTTVQRARNLILEKGLGVNSSAVEALLKPQSLVPTSNAFSDRLGPDIVPNFHSLFVPDLMHEWELGVWKGLMTHIVRILHAAKGGATREFNARFRRVPTFGRDVIRHFDTNMAEMKQFAAHDFEDLGPLLALYHHHLVFSHASTS
ncbi:hypothetical protein BN946_scf184791.g2 [Trametes cinnabarina]|uniref:Uncharacterized protein n=1 Tax=Pycnoporus cinnabarinus TaxID=5643 RepID=A0A060S4P2_PYCCI|nr:hypothetical protein BN946_scf184791.g2 [Trametes cinnabarina]